MIVARGYRAYRRRARAVALRAAGRTTERSGPGRWLWWAVRDEIESACSFLRDAFDDHMPLPAPWDLAVSRWVGRRRERRWPGWTPTSIGLPGFCTVCAARWRVGRSIKHWTCAQAFEHAAELAR